MIFSVWNQQWGLFFSLFLIKKASDPFRNSSLPFFLHQNSAQSLYALSFGSPKLRFFWDDREASELYQTLACAMLNWAETKKHYFHFYRSALCVFVWLSESKDMEAQAKPMLDTIPQCHFESQGSPPCLTTSSRVRKPIMIEASVFNP